MTAMSTATPSRLITTEEFLKLLEEAPRDVTLELIEGEVRENPMTTRSPRHSTAIARISHALLNWLESQSSCEGVVAAGEARCRILKNPDTTIGLDVACFEGTLFVEQADGSRFFDGPPVLAVEVLSPTDTHEDVNERIRLLLSAGVRQVWIADADFRTITVHRPQADQQLFTRGQTLTGEPELEGFACPVESLFSRQTRKAPSS
jgi:Uma2 family endonuclease